MVKRYYKKKIPATMSVAAMSHDAALDAGTCMDGRWRKNGVFLQGRLPGRKLKQRPWIT